ncbi:MAG: HupE/UreJ family protein [Bryobacterales bacterium]|nr:HupE/UreJ family protein [Bryobacterales bacterium]
MFWPFLLALTALDAHELGATRVSASFQPDMTYRIEIATDASSLASKLRRSAVEITDLAQLRSILTDFEPQFRRRVKLEFDTAEVRPALSFSLTPAINKDSAILATILLTGPIPSHARHFTWSYGWTFTPYSLTIRTAANPVVEWLEGGQRSKPFALGTRSTPEPRLTIVWRYLKLGFTHIFPHGLDHMLFVLGIFLLSRRLSVVLWQVSAFTLAHSITLALSLYGIVTVPPSIVEPLIALSIAYVAIENIFLTELKSWRVALVFAFGLLHGMGFAGALQEIGLPRTEFLTALITFNAGVEAGQLAVIAAAFLILGWFSSIQTWYRSRIVVPISAGIACTAVYWTIERLG